MNDTDFLEKLASYTPTHANASDRLGMLGKRAAGMYIGKEAGSLTEAVSSTVSLENDLSDEQVRRVTEIANQATWKEMYSVQGNRDVQFSPADSAVVIDQVSTRPEVVIRNPVMDYMQDPPGEQLADDVDLQKLFGGKEDALPAFNTSREVVDQHEKTAAAADVMRHGVDLLSPELSRSAERLYDLVKQAHLVEGAGFLQIARAVGQVTEDDFAQRTMEVIGRQLVSEGVVIDERKELSKLAQAVVIDYEHPVLVEAVRLEKIAQAFSRATSAKNKLEEQERAALEGVRASL